MFVQVPLLVGPVLSPLLPPDVSMSAPAVVFAALLRLCVLPLGAGVAARRCFPGGSGVLPLPKSLVLVVDC